MLSIKNTQRGPRGVNSVAGPVLLDPDQEIEVEVYAREKQHLEASGWFEISGSYAKDPKTSEGGAVSSSAADELKAARERIMELEADLANAQTGKPAFEAKHRGGGSYSIFDVGGNEVVEKLSKDDATTFNAMSDDDKAAFVESSKA